jgi:hypothetical protein
VGRHRHAVNVRVDGLAVVLGPLLSDVRISAAVLLDVDSGMVLDAWCAVGSPDDPPDLEVLGAQHAEVIRGALALLREWPGGSEGADGTTGSCEVVLGMDGGVRHLLRTVPDPHGDRLALAVVVDGPQRVLDRVRKRLRTVAVDALTAGPSTTRRPVLGAWSFAMPTPDVPAVPDPLTGLDAAHVAARTPHGGGPGGVASVVAASVVPASVGEASVGETPSLKAPTAVLPGTGAARPATALPGLMLPGAVPPEMALPEAALPGSVRSGSSGPRDDLSHGGRGVHGVPGGSRPFDRQPTPFRADLDRRDLPLPREGATRSDTPPAPPVAAPPRTASADLPGTIPHLRRVPAVPEPAPERPTPSDGDAARRPSPPAALPAPAPPRQRER